MVMTAQVVLNRDGFWSKPYSYLYDEAMDLQVGDIVLVPTGVWWSVGKISGFAESNMSNLKSVKKRLNERK